MIKSNLVAWTPAENNPPYLSINYLSSIDGMVEISIRERSKEIGKLGKTATITLTQDEFNEVLSELKKNIGVNTQGKEDSSNKCNCVKCNTAIEGCGVEVLLNPDLGGCR